MPRADLAGAGLFAGVILALALCAPLLASQNPFDPASYDLMAGFTPPVWLDGGSWTYPLGTDDQGRDMASTILHGLRLSLMVGLGAVALSAVLGTAIGMVAGWCGGWLDATLMRLADVQLTVPALLVAFMADGLARVLMSPAVHDALAPVVLICAIGIADWPQFARVARSATLEQKGRDYVAAARLAGVGTAAILARHVLPNALPPLLVLATLGLALAVIAEATLSFLGVGMPPTTPSLGTLIRVGGDFLYSGEWWIALLPAAVLVIAALAINLLGDALRRALDPGLNG